MSEAPIVCTMTLLTPAERDRHAELRRRLPAAAEGFEERDGGYSFRFPRRPEVLAQVAEFAALESRCCPFFSIGLELPAGEPFAWLHLTGPAGVKEFIQAELLAES